LNASHLSPFLRAPLSNLTALFSGWDFSQLDETALNAKLLERFAQDLCVYKTQQRLKRFVCQDSMPEEPRYYEQIIFEEDVIPTRKHSWHDFFNGLVWLQFPQTKTYLNHLHISEINSHGLKPRSKVRNHITHFDECGVVLFIKGANLYTRCKELFEKQAWSELFCELRNEWHTQMLPFIFGHANLEMLLSPFIGLTAKVLLIQIDEDRDESARLDSVEADIILCRHLQENRSLFNRKPFYPLPLLGIPNWHYAKQDQQFYDNTDYFMPKRQ
jgi:hypothetical protein